MQHVFIIGSKGIPGSYGGYETFVDKLTEYHQDNQNIRYHVACKNVKAKEYEYHNARCFCVKVPDIGSPQAIYYDIASFKKCCQYIKKNGIEHPIIYILACRVGLVANYIENKTHKLGGKLYINPDGHEWMRAKWPKPVRLYWKHSEKRMVKHSDLVICDSKNIEQYIKKEYFAFNPKTTYITYGAETRKSQLNDKNKKLISWYKSKKVTVKEYYLVVGRLVPENNYKVMIAEFMKSKTTKDLVLITNENNAFLERLKCETNFVKDTRIKFVGSVYNQELLKKIRENAYGYIHGHEVGGTNPSLLEALGSTELNLLLDVGFNREVGENAAFYWTKAAGNLADLISKADKMSENEIKNIGNQARKRIDNFFNWADIAHQYDNLFRK